MDFEKISAWCLILWDHQKNVGSVVGVFFQNVDAKIHMFQHIEQMVGDDLEVKYNEGAPNTYIVESKRGIVRTYVMQHTTFFTDSLNTSWRPNLAE